MLPPPVRSGFAVVENLRPRVGYELPAVGPVGDLEVGHVLSELLGELLGGEAHGRHVVDAALEQLRRRREELPQRAQAVADVHHGQPGVGPQVALELTRPQRLEEHEHGVVGGTAAGRVRGDDAGEA